MKYKFLAIGTVTLASLSASALFNTAHASEKDGAQHHQEQSPITQQHKDVTQPQVKVPYNVQNTNNIQYKSNTANYSAQPTDKATVQQPKVNTTSNNTHPSQPTTAPTQFGHTNVKTNATNEGVFVILPNNNRDQVSNTTQEHYQPVAFVRIPVEGGDLIASSVVVGRDAILTNKHVAKGANMDPKSLHIFPAANGDGNYPYGEFIGEQIIPYPGAGDLVIVKMAPNDKGQHIGDVVKPATLSQNKDTQLGNDITVTGYPGDKPVATMWDSFGKITYLQGEAMQYDLSTTGGNSGSPVYNGRGEVIGIHWGGVPDEFNGAVFLNQDVQNFLKDNISDLHFAGENNDPGNDNNPDNPGDHDNPSNPGDHNQPTDPGNGNNPDNPDDHDNPSNSGDHNQPTDPGNDNNPDNPGDHDNPSNPGDHNQPTDPGNNNKPDNPGHHDNPSNPGDHNQPTSPGNDNNQGNSGNHDNNSNPGNHNQPTNPGNNNNQGNSGSHDNNSNPGNDNNQGNSGNHDNNSNPGDHNQPTSPGNNNKPAA